MEENKILNNLQAPGIEFGSLPKPGGSYVAVNIRGNIAYVAIQFPIKEGKFFFTGRFGEGVTTEEGYKAARLAAMNVLGQINKFVGFDNITMVIKTMISGLIKGQWYEFKAVVEYNHIEINGDKKIWQQ